MLAKTIFAATLALAATVQAAVPNHTHFNDPVSAEGDLSLVLIAGGNYTYSWSTSCATGEIISPNPTAVEVQLVKANTANSASLAAHIGTVDCTAASGRQTWSPPVEQANTGDAFSLRLVLGPVGGDVYSGKFLIKTKDAPADKPAATSGGATNPSATPAGGKSGASILTPVLAGAAAVAAGALMFL
ncbi:hypothetical protein BGZ96_007757 [Linnemannia gamsii]|uniref:Uncharacterized protein n=1 Tax=Linnemannia gamsii TaxID=64522 RepID=A0ABQ7K0R3_9FUNG|nr:hypothetical protein BGZ96_007757 [Linnemannia gamsii]